MTLRLSLIALAPVALLAGCNTAGTLNQGLDSVHQPVVRHADYVFDLATDGGVLAPGEGARLNGWMGTLGLHYGDTIAVDGGGAYGAARDQVAGAAARYGLLLADSLPATVSPPAPGMVRVAVSRMIASVPGCSDYSRMYVPDYSQSTSSNFGCAINANLAAMVARPEDLVRGESRAGANDPATSTKAIESYRKATTTGSGGALQAASTGGK